MTPELPAFKGHRSMPREQPHDDRGRGEASAASGLAFLLPGVPQWLARQRERGLVLLATYVSSLSIGLFAWGTRTGVVLVAFAYLTHVLSATDAIHRWAFPGFGRWVPAVSTSTGLAVFCYGPLILFGSLIAWPGFEAGDTDDSYLINRLAYQERDPEPGEHVWLGSSRDGTGDRVGLVLAGPGEDVEWSAGRLLVGGRRAKLMPFQPGYSPRHLAFKVPDDRYLIAYQTSDPVVPDGWEMLPKSQVEGRAWAKFYPVWQRRIIP
jgi:hypothetical protein